MMWLELFMKAGKEQSLPVNVIHSLFLSLRLSLGHVELDPAC